MVANARLTQSEFAALKALNDAPLPSSNLDSATLQSLLRQGLARELSAGRVGISSRGLDRLAEERGLPVSALGGKPVNGNGGGQHLPESLPKTSSTAQTPLPTMSEKSLEALVVVHEAGDAGISTADSKAHHKTIGRLRTLKLIRQRGDQLYITGAGIDRLRAEGLIAPMNGVNAVEGFAAALEQSVVTVAPDDDPPTPDDSPNQIEVMVSADTPEEAIATLREITDAIEQGIAATPAEHDDATGCGDCQAPADCLDRRVLHMLMAARPEVVAIYNAEATRESAEMLRDSLLRSFKGED